MKGFFNSGVVLDVFSQSSFKHWLVLVIFWNPIHKRILFAIAFVGLLGAFQLAQAELDNTVEFNIVAQPLGSALLQFSEQADVQLVVAAKNLEGIVTNGIKGMAKVGYALESLLANTGLEYRTIGDTVTVSIIDIEGESEEPPLTSGAVKAVWTGALESQTDESPVSGKKRFDRFRLEEVVVLGERVVVRNRSNTIEPELTYSAEYFERFEPLTVSDMLKRVPGVFFDQLLNQPQGTNGDGSPRSQVPRLRNLDASYSQILLNGRKVAGIDLGTGGGDFFGAIPAEAVQEVQVIRSPSAEIGSSGVGMTLNIILKDGARYQSNTWRAAGISYDGDFSGLASLQLAGSNDSYTYSLGLTYQDRPSGSTTKTTSSHYYDLDATPQNYITVDSQQDIDKNILGSIDFNIGARSHLKLEGRYFQTDSDYTSHRELDYSPSVDCPPCTDDENAETTTKNTALGATYFFDTDKFSWESYLGYNKADIEAYNVDGFGTHKPDYITMSRRTTADTTEYLFNNHFAYRLSERSQFRFGVDYTDTSTRNQADGVSGFGTPYNLSDDTQDSDKLDGYLIYEVDLGSNVNLQIGGRYESDDYDSSATSDVNFTGDPLDPPFSFDENVLSETARTTFAASTSGLNPSAHLKWAITENQDLRLSVAQTVRRPSLFELDPRVLFWYGNVNYNTTSNPRITYGNPELGNETALGVDIGYDLHLENGVIGLNVYSRDVGDRIIQDRVTMEEFSSARPVIAAEVQRFRDYQIENMLPGYDSPMYIVTSANSNNKATARGVELDMSLPLTFISDNANFYANVSYSELSATGEIDEETTAINFGYDHFMDSIGFTYGFSYNQITDYSSKIVDTAFYDQTTIQSKNLDPNVEIFAEKRFGEKLLVRLSIENVLDAKQTVMDTWYLELFNAGSNNVTVTDTSPRYVLTFRGTF